MVKMVEMVDNSFHDHFIIYVIILRCTFKISSVVRWLSNSKGNDVINKEDFTHLCGTVRLFVGFH